MLSETLIVNHRSGLRQGDPLIGQIVVSKARRAENSASSLTHTLTELFFGFGIVFNSAIIER